LSRLQKLHNAGNVTEFLIYWERGDGRIQRYTAFLASMPNYYDRNAGEYRETWHLTNMDLAKAVTLKKTA
jgi:hypothetical protein